MTDSPMNIDAELAAIRNYIMAVQDLLKNGQMPNMTSIEQRTALVCNYLQQAPKDIQEKCLPELRTLLEQLTECERDLRAFHATLANLGSGHDKS